MKSTKLAIRVDKESVKNSQQHLGNKSNVILRRKYQPCFEATFSVAWKRSILYFLWRQLYKEDFRCLLIYSLQSTILVQSAGLKCDTADVNFPSSFVCTMANSGYNRIFSLTDILQIAVVIRQVVLVLFLPIFHRAFRFPCLCLAIATVFQVGIPVARFKRNNLVEVWTVLFIKT